MASAAAFIRKLWKTDAPLTAVGLFMLVLLGSTGVALIVDSRSIAGAPAWLKPAKFAASIAIYTLTLAWVYTYLPEWKITRRSVSWITVVTLMLEIVIIDLQAWRGTSSHFNIATPLDGFLFDVMGIAIVVQTLSAVAVAVALWRQRFDDPAMGWALRLGMTITIAGALSGGLMIPPTAEQRLSAREGRMLTVAGGHAIGGPDGGPGLAGTGWSIEYGDLRVAHFVGLHALQILPLTTILLLRDRRHDHASSVRLVWILSATYVALYALLLWQAFRGQSVVKPDGLTLAVFALWMICTVGSLSNLRARTPRSPHQEEARWHRRGCSPQ